MILSREHPILSGLDGLRASLGRFLSRWMANARYRPERHYMRGPGPKARARRPSDD